MEINKFIKFRSSVIFNINIDLTTILNIYYILLDIYHLFLLIFNFFLYLVLIKIFISI